MSAIRKLLIGIAASLLALFVNSSSTPAGSEGFIISKGIRLLKVPRIVEGMVPVRGETPTEGIKILVTKDSYQEWFRAQVNNGIIEQEIYLISGKGAYEITVMKNIKDNIYEYGPGFSVENIKEVNRFLVPTNGVESNAPEITGLSAELVKGSKSSRDKAFKIYDWVIRNISYDLEKLVKQKNNDFSSLYSAVNTLKTRKGVCYDYSLLVAALGRAQGLQVKIIKGYYKSPGIKELHAWNEIYLPEENKWINLDSTFGSVYGKSYFDIPDFFNDHEKTSEY